MKCGLNNWMFCLSDCLTLQSYYTNFSLVYFMYVYVKTYTKHFCYLKRNGLMRAEQRMHAD